jgi:hypothetical protein
MTYGLRLLGVGVLMAMGALAVAQQRPPSERPRRASTKAPLDARVLASIRQITAATTRPKIEKLASFGTRHTLSVHHPELAQKGRGIVAAREWIKAEFERYSQECGGCLEVAFDTFMQEPRDRVPKPTEVANVYAVLRGTDPAQADRVFLVTGHYDSRASDPLDPIGDAPGANDDASGTVVSLEAARALSKHKFPASIIFLAVAGEEQGLLGARHFAQLAQEKGWKIEGVLNNDIVGGNKGPGQDPDVVRVFSEGIPVTAKEADIRRIMATGGETGTLCRGVRGGDRRGGCQDGVPARPVSARRRPFGVQRIRRAGGALHRVPRGLQPPAQRPANGKRHRIWRPAEVRGLRLRRARRAAECDHAGAAGFGAATAAERAAADQATGE